MKQKSLLLLGVSLLITLACFGTSEPTNLPGDPAIPSATGGAPSDPNLPVGSSAASQQGITVVYSLAGNLWLWGESASARQLTNDGDATQVKISEDGAVIAYQRGQTLWAINADGSSPRPLVDIVAYASPILPARGTDLQLDEFQFQPGTHTIYFTTAWNGIRSNDLHRVDADAPNPQALLTDGGGDFTFSPNNNLLALVSPTDIKVINTDGSGLVTALSYPLISNQIEYRPNVVWMNDSTALYTAMPSNGKFRFLYIAATGSFSAQLSEFTAAPVEISAPLISPDGLKVAYVYQTATSFDLHMTEASNTDTIIASYPGASHLDLLGWSPDSKRVVFSNSTPASLLTAGIGIPATPLAESISPASLRWIDAERFIFFRQGNLLIGQINNPETIIVASGFSNDQAGMRAYDFSISPVP